MLPQLRDVAYNIHRFTTPKVDFYMRGIADDDFNIDMAQTSDEKDEAAKAKASKTWRTLRLAARTKLNLLDKIEDGKNLKVLFEEPVDETPEQADDTMANGTQEGGKEGSVQSESLTDQGR